jgi:hypothetical protein
MNLRPEGAKEALSAASRPLMREFFAAIERANGCEVSA